MTRKAIVERTTKETKITVAVNLDGTGKFKISTSNGFLTHMLEQLSYHSLIDLTIEATGDEHIDMHHQTEDIAISLGAAIKQALQDKIGINRYGHSYITMDEALTRTVIDISGRPSFVFNAKFPQTTIGSFDLELVEHFFLSFANTLNCALHIKNLYGSNSHHIAESCFKSFAKTLRTAVELDTRKLDSGVAEPASTKGIL